jgi:ABC-type transport system involved in Fe-S cluster assembly fused permease/ATPase subunit
VKEELKEDIILRKSVIYGKEDRLIRKYKKLWRKKMRDVKMWKKGEKKVKKNVFVYDVEDEIVNEIKDKDDVGKKLKEVGKKSYIMGEIVEWIYEVMRKERKWG